jgi:hypothetical protein
MLIQNNFSSVGISKTRPSSSVLGQSRVVLSKNTNLTTSQASMQSLDPYRDPLDYNLQTLQTSKNSKESLSLVQTGHTPRIKPQARIQSSQNIRYQSLDNTKGLLRTSEKVAAINRSLNKLSEMQKLQARPSSSSGCISTAKSSSHSFYSRVPYEQRARMRVASSILAHSIPKKQ